MKRLPSQGSYLYREVTRLTGKKPRDAFKAKTVTQKPSSVVPGRLIGFEERKLPSGGNVQFLYQPAR